MKNIEKPFVVKQHFTEHPLLCAFFVKIRLNLWLTAPKRPKLVNYTFATQ